MAPTRFSRDKKAREVTPYREEAAPASIIPLRPTTPHPDRQPSPVVAYENQADRPVTPAPPEWTSYDAPINFTWVIPDELCGMGWPKSRDQVRFLVDQGIDHLVSLSPEKIPPHYAFPDLKHTLIPVEDFTGPTISEIQKFIEITDDARKEGEAVGVHCAEGRGRTGVMCACYLIYYYDMEPWDAIRIMRRQRPGSVERKVQEETVVKFYTLLQDYGKSSLENLEQREKEMAIMQKRQQAELMRNDGKAAQQATYNLLHHMHSFHTRQSAEAKQERVTRMRRAKSMPKMEDEEEVNAAKLKNHLQSFLQGECRTTKVQRSRSSARGKTDDEDASDSDLRSRGTTPGRALLEEVSLKPVGERNIKTLDPPPKESETCELKNHFRDFMRTPASVKRGRSFSQPRDKAEKGEAGGEGGSGGSSGGGLSRNESFEHKYVQDRNEPESGELANHTKRFLKRKSMINTNKMSDDSDNDVSVVKDKPVVEKDNRDMTPSDNDIDGSSSPSLVTSKPPPPVKPQTVAAGGENNKTAVSKSSSSTTVASQRRFRNRLNKTGGAEGENSEPDAYTAERSAAERRERRRRSKSDITVPKVYDLIRSVGSEVAVTNGCHTHPSGEEEKVESDKPTGASKEKEIEEADVKEVDELGESLANSHISSNDANHHSEGTDQESSGTTVEDVGSDAISSPLANQRIRKNNLNSYSEYVYVSTPALSNNYNSKPKPFISSTAAGKSCGETKNELGLDETKEKQLPHHYQTEVTDRNHELSYSSSTADIMNACKSGLRRLTYRKTYSRSRSTTQADVEADYDKNNNTDSTENSSSSSNGVKLSSNITYTQHSSGNRLPNRPTTPGPYMGYDRSLTSSLYKRPTTPGPFSRDSWKRTNQKFNYSKFLNYSGHETYV